METLLFENPVFRGGLNFTVRLGEKWNERLSVGDFVYLGSAGHLGLVRKIYVCEMAEVPAEVLEKEHDPRCRRWEGLVDTLGEIYPEVASAKGSEEVEAIVVTCVGFWVYKRLVGEENV